LTVEQASLGRDGLYVFVLSLAYLAWW